MSWLQRFWKRIPPKVRTFQFVRLHRADDYLKCGWIPHDSLSETPHGEYSVLMEYLECDCGRAMPRPGHAVVKGAIPDNGERG